MSKRKKGQPQQPTGKHTHRPLLGNGSEGGDNNFTTERLMWCKNKTCTAFKTIFDTHRDVCGICQWELEAFDYQHDDMIDQPPLRDTGMRTTDNLPLLGNGSHKPTSTVDSKREATSAKQDEPAVFESDCDISGQCPIAKKGIINVPFELYCTWVYLARKFRVEWIAYLRGKVEDNGEITLAGDGMFFPVQRANGAHVDAALNTVPEGTIASIHSHVDMDAFFSGEDRDHFNHTADLVVNTRGDIKAVMRQQLDCHRWSRAAASIMLHGNDDNIGAYNLLKEKLIVQREPAVTVNSYGDPNSYYRSGSQIITKGQHGISILDSRRYRPVDHTPNDQRRDS